MCRWTGSALVQVMTCRHYLNQCWLIVKWTPGNKIQWNSNRNSIIFIEENAFQGRWVKSLWPGDAIWRQGSRSTLVQAMAWCLTAPSHYLNQCWLIITKVQLCSSEGNFAWDIIAISHKISLKIIFLRFYWDLPGVNELKDGVAG